MRDQDGRGTVRGGPDGEVQWLALIVGGRVLEHRYGLLEARQTLFLTGEGCLVLEVLLINDAVQEVRVALVERLEPLADNFLDALWRIHFNFLLGGEFVQGPRVNCT